jgi:hypothetical protein
VVHRTEGVGQANVAPVHHVISGTGHHVKGCLAQREGADGGHHHDMFCTGRDRRPIAVHAFAISNDDVSLGQQRTCVLQAAVFPLKVKEHVTHSID